MRRRTWQRKAAEGLRGAPGPALAVRWGGGDAPLSPLFVWLCSSCAASRPPQEGTVAVFLWLFVVPQPPPPSPLPSPPPATAPWCRLIQLGWICLWCAYHKVCHHLGETGWLCPFSRLKERIPQPSQAVTLCVCLGGGGALMGASAAKLPLHPTNSFVPEWERTTAADNHTPRNHLALTWIRLTSRWLANTHTQKTHTQSVELAHLHVLQDRWRCRTLFLDQPLCFMWSGFEEPSSSAI